MLATYPLPTHLPRIHMPAAYPLPLFSFLLIPPPRYSHTKLLPATQIPPSYYPVLPSYHLARYTHTKLQRGVRC